MTRLPILFDSLISSLGGITINTYDTLKLENQLCFPLYACAKEVVRRYRKPLEKLGLTYTQYIVMMALWEHGRMIEREIGEIVHLDSGTLTPLLRRLEKQGLITRTRPENSENKLFIELTERGEKLKDEALTVPEEMANCIALSEDELLTLKLLLDKAVKNLNS